MYCYKCGKFLEENVQFCPYCGTTIQQQVQAPPQQVQAPPQQVQAPPQQVQAPPQQVKTGLHNMNWGGTLIVISSIIAFISFFLPWVDIRIVSRNGLEQGTVLLFLFYLYPLIKLYKNKEMSKLIGIILAILSIIMDIFYIQSNSTNLFGKTVNVSGIGTLVFAVSSALLIIGIIGYKAHRY